MLEETMGEYLDAITELLARIEREEAGPMARAADLVADVICRDGLLHVFGCGHSHLAALDTFYRAGGLACVSPVLDEDLMLHDGAAKSSRMEKMSGIAAEVYRRHDVKAGDLFVVISASGKNAAPVEMLRAAKSSRMEKMPGIAAEVYRRHDVKAGDLFVVISASGKNAAPVEMLRAAKADGVKTVAISSSSYRAHGAVLLDEADIPIDCKVPHGDAVIDVGGAKMGGLSTYASLFILNSILIEGARKAEARGVKPPIYVSGNVEGGAARNVALEERYLGRVKHL